MDSKDYLVEPEDVISDAVWEAIEDSDWDGDIDVDHDKFFREIHSRTNRVKVELAFKVLGAKDRHEFEELLHQLCLMGAK